MRLLGLFPFGVSDAIIEKNGLPFMRNLIVVLLLLVILPVETLAQPVRQWWLDMPDSVAGYMNKSKRIEALDYCDIGLKIDVTNLFESSTMVDTLTNDFMQVRMSKAMLLQMQVLPADSDTVVCVVHTFYGPEPESSVELYNRQWEKLYTFEPDLDIDHYVERPDTMSIERYNLLRAQLEPVLVYSQLDVNASELITGLSPVMLMGVKKDDVKVILKQRKLKWNGRMFIEC